MRKVRPLAFANPPVWELGISVGFGSFLVNMYDIKEIHGLFSDRFPRPEKQPNFAGLDPFPAPNSVPTVPQIIFQSPGLSRWWFVSDTGNDLIQVQENFFARNWRRLTAPPESVSYPGFDAIFEEFRESISTLTSWSERNGNTSPPPAIAEVLYDNLIPLDRKDGSPVKFSEVVKALKFDPPFKAGGMQLTWLQYVDDDADESTPLDLQVEISRVSLTIPPTARQYAKLTFRARRPVSSWTAAFEFMSDAHAKLRDRLVELTTDECRATWE